MAVLRFIARALCGGARLRRLLAGGVALATLASVTPLRAAEATPSAEYQVKAAFLYNFAQFVEWPARAFPAPDSPLIIGVLGENPFGTYLEEDLVKGEKEFTPGAGLRTPAERSPRGKYRDPCGLVFG